MVFTAIFINISVILWPSVLLVEETRVQGENLSYLKGTNWVNTWVIKGNSRSYGHELLSESFASVYLRCQIRSPFKEKITTVIGLMLLNLLLYIFYPFANKVFHEIVGIPTGTNHTPLIAYYFLTVVNLNLWLNSK